MSLYEDFLENRNEEKAIPMAKYLRNQFKFLGIQSKQRRNLVKEFFKSEKKKGKINWDFVFACWECEYREMQYVATDYLTNMKDFLEHDDIFKLKKLVLEKSWWDSIDSLVKTIGYLALKYPDLNDVLLEWSMDDNFWLRRVAIIHQLHRKEKLDTDLLEEIIKNNLNQEEFFINKAIGWILRDYSKTNPDWVKSFIDKYRDDLANISIKEGSKYLD